MQAFAVIVAKIRSTAGFVVPRLVGGARLQGRENPDHSRVCPTFFQNGLDLVFFAEVLLTHVVDLQTVGGRHILRVGFDGVSEWLGKLSEVENANPPFAQIRRHPIGIAEDW